MYILSKGDYMHKILMLVVMTMILTGCITGQRNDGRQESPVDQRPVVNVESPKLLTSEQVKDQLATQLDATKKDIRQEILTSTNSTQNQMQGLLNASVSKIADQVKGVEANLKDLLTINNTANIEVKNKLENTITAVNQMKAELNTTIQAVNQMSVQLQVVNEMKLQLEKLNAQAAASASAQIGWNNKYEQKLENITETISNSAGRDVNYLPKEAVQIMLDRERTFTYFIGGILALATTIISFAYKFARQREAGRRQEEVVERKETYGLVMKLLAMVSNKRSPDIIRQIEDHAKKIAPAPS
jgi:hypothetical protein